ASRVSARLALRWHARRCRGGRCPPATSPPNSRPWVDALRLPARRARPTAAPAAVRPDRGRSRSAGRVRPRMARPHVDDEFHPPTSDDPYWTETCWFTFTVPERRLSGQLYPFFRPNQRVCAGAAYLWDDKGNQAWNVIYGKNFWHLPLPDQPLSVITL